MAGQQVRRAGPGSRAVGAERVLRVLAELASEPDGVSLEELAARVGGTKPTVHRALALLQRQRLGRQVSRGRYSLGEEFLRLAFAYHERRSELAEIEQVLHRLSHTFGETAHFAVLDGVEVVYQAKVDPPQGAIRLTSVVGGRNPAYRTGVGKLLLAHHVGSRAELEQLLAGRPLERSTPNTITRVDALWEALEATRQRGYAVDDQENEPGVNCVALPVYMGSPSTPAGAVSVSGLAFRTSLQELVSAVPRMRELLDPYTSEQSPAGPQR